jgi:hypothetical protein
MSSIPPPPPNMGPPPGYTPYGGDGGGTQSTSGKAIAALVCGILNIVGCSGIIVMTVLAIVFGVQGQKEVDASNGRLTGRGMATAGLVLGIIGAVLTPAIWWWALTQAGD